MPGKKKDSASWKLAGEPINPPTLSTADERIFSEKFSFHKEFRSDIPDTEFLVSLSAMRIRESAARAVLGFLCREFGEKYQQSEIIKAVATAVSLPFSITEKFVNSLPFLMGAALWLLDYAAREGVEDELLSLLPDDPDDGMIFRSPMVDDFTHSPDDILRLMTVLQNRNTTGRSAFRKIMRMIDKDAAAALRNAFKACFLDYFGRYMEVCSRVKPASLSDKPGFSPPDFRTTGPDLFSAVAATMRDEPDVTFLILTSALVGAPEEELRSQLHYRRSINALRGFKVSDPYAVCAAYFLLEKEEDALASLNTLTSAVVSCAEQHLPWGAGEPQAWPVSFEKGSPDYELRHAFVESDVETDEPDELPDVPVEAGQMLSEAQLFYLTTGYALPRRRVPSQELAGWFVKQGLPKERAQMFAFGAMLAHYQDALRDQIFWHRPFDDYEEDDTAAEEPAPAQQEKSESCDAVQIAVLTRQIRDLRRALHESEQTAKQFQEQVFEKERQSARDRMELSQLREVLYRMKSGEEQPDQQIETAIELPWRVTRRVLIFGGHETWLKAIRPLLPGARFFEPDSLPDLGVLKSADVVWIQSNALSHKFFYRVINSARKENIPVRYFGYASARKCAEQLVVDEMLADKEADS